ncbi:MAG: SDR family oxidoreductase [Deltaproteobacteria bacterium]|nr:SDR family oxidoreductase [Deltaproteobacteria bacterium]MBW1963443.1 SDR family oxidoreductase [Deltaproteobacteria bacterium]MBW2154195.1 SDR family oxidoreductase [Deltaproteobacteria bacterium]
MDISNQVVIITGGSRGIGKALAQGFASDGANVIISGRNENSLKETASFNPERIVAVSGDVTSEADVDRLVNTAIDRFGGIDVLINNAGIVKTGRLLERPFEDWVEVIRVNLIGLALCTYKVLPHMIKRGYGRIINLASRAAEFAHIGMSSYAASKAAVASFTKTIAAEVGPPEHPDILINSLIPGPTQTELYEQTGLGQKRGQPGQDPKVVYQHALFVATLPANGPHGKIFWNSKEYRIYEHFND